jgi:hypothetical protein
MRASDQIWQFLKESRFADAVRIGEAELAKDGRDAWEVAGNRAHAYLQLGRYVEAYDCYALRDRIDQKLRSGLRHLHPMAQVAWLLKLDAQAATLAKEDVELLAAGDTTMADAAGGVANALFYYYCGSKLRDEGAKSRALEFIRHLAKRSGRFRNWPGPIGAFYLGDISFEEVLFAASRQRDLPKALAAAGDSPLVKRELIQALFYAGARRRDLSDDAGCTALMEAASALRNPFAELEWYLACKEANERTPARAENSGDA